MTQTGRQLLLVCPYLYYRGWVGSKMCMVEMIMMMIGVDERSLFAVGFLMGLL